MSIDEFKKQVKDRLVIVLNDKKYVDSLDDDIEKTYNQAKELEPILGYGEPSVGGYVAGISLLYPDLP